MTDEERAGCAAGCFMLPALLLFLVLHAAGELFEIWSFGLLKNPMDWN